MKHVTLIELSLQHPYYTDGRCPDFIISATAETERLLRNHRCSLSVSEDRLRVICSVDDVGAAFVRFREATALRFSLKLRSADFALFSDLTGLVSASDQPTPLFRSAGAADGQLVLAANQTAEVYTPGIFANVELTVAAQDETSVVTTASYYIRFAAKQARWAFYCVTDLAASSGELRIVDASPSGTTDVVVFSDENRRNLDEDPDPLDLTAVQLLSQYPTLRCVRILSDELITCRQQPRKYLELRRGDERLAGPLPNPSLRQVARDDQLFQVIKYRTQPFLTQ